MAGRNYQDLIAWQKAMDLVVQVYQTTKSFPKEELYGLTSQLRRAVVSIPSNIAEGRGRVSAREFQHFLSIAYGSLREVETQLIIACRLAYMAEEVHRPLMELAGEVGRLTQGLLNSLSTR